MFLRKKNKPNLPSRASLPRTPAEFPTGIAVRTEKGIYRIHMDGKRYRIPSKRVLESWSFPIIADASEASLSNYPVAISLVGFRDGTLLNNISNGKLYLVSSGSIRHVIDPDILSRLGITPQDAMVVSEKEIHIMKEGEPIY